MVDIFFTLETVIVETSGFPIAESLPNKTSPTAVRFRSFQAWTL